MLGTRELNISQEEIIFIVMVAVGIWLFVKD